MRAARGWLRARGLRWMMDESRGWPRRRGGGGRGGGSHPAGSPAGPSLCQRPRLPTYFSDFLPSRGGRAYSVSRRRPFRVATTAAQSSGHSHQSQSPSGLALDPSAGQVYWSDSGVRRIQRADLDGSGVEDLVTRGLRQPLGLAVDTATDRIYWTTGAPTASSTPRLDGATAESHHHRPAVPPGPRPGPALRLPVLGGLRHRQDPACPPDGSGEEDVITENLDTPYGLAVGAGLPARRALPRPGGRPLELLAVSGDETWA